MALSQYKLSVSPVQVAFASRQTTKPGAFSRFSSSSQVLCSLPYHTVVNFCEDSVTKAYLYKQASLIFMLSSALHIAGFHLRSIYTIEYA